MSTTSFRHLRSYTVLALALMLSAFAPQAGKAQTGIAIATNATLPDATEGVPYTLRLIVENATPPIRWSIGAGLPPEITLDAATGVLSGTPTTRGTYSFTVQVTDANASANKTFTLRVQVPPLVITTFSPLFNAVAGFAYSQTFAGSGGTPPYIWSMRPTVPGLTLDRTTGVLAGTPERAGSHNITVELGDASGTTTSKDFTFTIEEPQLRITNSSPLPPGTVGVSYQQRFLATGGRLPYTWAITSGGVPGFTLEAGTGVLSATPTTPGTVNLTVLVRDSTGATASRAFTLAIAAGPLKLTPIPDTLRATAGEALSLPISASGGVPPYSWAVNGLPEGLDIDSSGQITGAARVPGSYPFTVRVTDTARASVTELFRLDVSAPSVPALRISGLPVISKAADQATFHLELAAPYTLPISGQLSISFVPETGTGDPAVQFSTGGRTLDFEIPAGATAVQLPTSSVGLQTGTVAGTITLLLRMQTQGVNLTPTPATLQTIRVERSAPVITAGSFSRTDSGIEIRITGYSTAREITQGIFRFTAAPGNTLSTSELTLPLDEAFGRWFRDAESSQYGGQFTFMQQFAVQGAAGAVTPVSITLTNRMGSTTFNIR